MIEATFWGEFVLQSRPHLEGSTNKPIIVVMQLIQAHKFKGKYYVRNSWTASKLWINPELPEVAEFISRMKDVRGDRSERISQMSSQNNSSGSIEVTTIKELIECMDDSVAENDVISISNTPAKRSISESESSVVKVDDDIKAQLSSSKVKRVTKE
ncbi:hypothetical protein P3S68_001738 [Capsicum galapagoense]